MEDADPGQAPGEAIGPPSDVLLRRLPSLTVHIDSDNSITVDAGPRQIRCGHHGLAVLQAFSQPTSIADAIKQLEGVTQSAQDWMEMTSTVMGLHRAGILTEEGGGQTSRGGHGGNFHSPPIHVAMLDDRPRTSAFLEALREVVQPGDVVVDVGTGTGVLAVAAAQAGANKVYAIEAGGASRWAKAIFRANGFEDRITLVEGWSSQITLPEPADVLVSETIGNEALGEHVLEMVRDARKRLLKPGARVIPRRVKVYAVPLSVPAGELSRRTFTPEGARRWEAAYGIDFGPLVESGQSVPFVFAARPGVVKDWPRLSDPVLVADLNLEHAEQVSVDTTTSVEAPSSGVLNGVMAYFELELSPGRKLAPKPFEDSESSWRSPVWVLAQPLELTGGERFAVHYRHRVAGVGFNETITVSGPA